MFKAEEGGLHYTYIMFKAVEGLTLYLYHVQSCRGGLHYVYIMFKAEEGAYIIFMSWLKL